MTELRTPRLTLRRARPDDLDAFHAILSDPKAMRYWSSAPHQSADQTREWLAAMMAEGPPASDDFVIELDGRAIGKAGCWRVPEIGYILHPHHWGRGFAAEAVDAVIAHTFATHAIPAIKADVDPRNEASLKLLARFGFVETGHATATWEVNGEICDSVYLALARPT